jgi:hypothetical protein
MRKVLSKKREVNSSNANAKTDNVAGSKVELATLIASVKRKSGMNSKGRGKRVKESIL